MSAPTRTVGVAGFDSRAVRHSHITGSIRREKSRAHNGVITAFFGATFPTGSVPNGSGTTVFTPTLAVGNGWRSFDVQSTAAMNLPFNGTEKTVAWNTALQWHVARVIWPEIETNATWFTTSGRQQTFVTSGVIFGRFHVTRSVGLSLGTGVSLAASSYHTESRRWTFTVRFPFPIRCGE